MMKVIKRYKEWLRKVRLYNPDLGMYVMWAFVGIVLLLKMKQFLG